MLGNHADPFFLGHARENVLAGKPNSISRGYSVPDRERVSSLVLAGGALPGMSGGGSMPGMGTDEMGGEMMPGMSGGGSMPGMGALSLKTGMIIGGALLAVALIFKLRR